MANNVQVYDHARAISWEPGQDVAGDGNLEFGGWIWRYDLSRVNESDIEVTLSYDWSAVAQFLRNEIPFPPFTPDHLDNSLSHPAKLVAPAH